MHCIFQWPDIVTDKNEMTEMGIEDREPKQDADEPEQDADVPEPDADVPELDADVPEDSRSSQTFVLEPGSRRGIYETEI